MEWRVFPVCFLNYNRFVPRGTFFLLGYPETALGYKFSRQLSLKLNAVYSSATFRLSEDSPVAKDGYFSSDELSCGLYIDYSPKPFIKLGIGADYFFYRELTFYEKDADKIEDFMLGNSWGGRIQAEISF